MSIAPGPDNAQQAAAFHGLALNQAYPLAERYELALKALALYEAEVELARPLVDAALTWASSDDSRATDVLLATVEAYEHERDGGGS